MSKKSGKIDIGKQFSRYPAGRTVIDGDYSGEVFQKKLLFPALADNDVVEILLDNALSYGSSFLEEAFAGLIRDRVLSPEEFHRRIKFVTSDQILMAEVRSYVSDEIGRLEQSG